MRITSYELMEILNSEIAAYNEKFHDDDFKEKRLPHIEEGEDISDETLSKIEKMNISIRPERLSEEEIETFNSELQAVLEKMNLKILTFQALSSTKKPIECDLNFLNAVNHNVENLRLNGVDLSEQSSELLSRFDSLKLLALDHCNISNPEIISTVDGSVDVSLKQNTIDSKYYKEIIDLVEKHDGKLGTTDKELQKVADAFRWKRIDIQTFLETRECVDYEKVPGLYICIDSSFAPSKDDIEKTVDILNSTSNSKINISIEDFRRLSGIKTLTIPTRITIRNAGEISSKEIEENSNIESVAIEDKKNSVREQAVPYTREEFLSARKRIDEIVSSVEMPEDTDKNREKKIFAQVYKKLAEQIVYDHYAASKEAKKDEKLAVTSRNLYGGLVQGKAVCAGYADILRNVLSCFNIDAIFIGELPSLEAGHTIRLDDGGHAWNVVTLDCKSYLTDLTWDRDYIVSNKYPLPFCLKSKADFGHNSFSTSNSEHAEYCKESLSKEEQIELFTGKKIGALSLKDTRLAYLGSGVSHFAEQGITGLQIRGAHSELVQATREKSIKNPKEVGERSE